MDRREQRPASGSGVGLPDRRRARRHLGLGAGDAPRHAGPDAAASSARAPAVRASGRGGGGAGTVTAPRADRSRPPSPLRPGPPPSSPPTPGSPRRRVRIAANPSSSPAPATWARRRATAPARSTSSRPPPWLAPASQTWPTSSPAPIPRSTCRRRGRIPRTWSARSSCAASAATRCWCWVDGKRRHETSNIFADAGPQQGATPVDINMIPAAAIDHIEVLRDGPPRSTVRTPSPASST